MKTHHPLFFAVLLALSVTIHAQDNVPPAAAPPQSEIQKWLATTDAQWKATFKREVTDVHEAELGKVKAQYRTALEAAIAKASAAGDLDGAVVLRNEQERFVDTNVIPAQDLATDAASVKQLRAPVRIALAKMETDHAARIKALHAKYDQMLAQVQTQFTQRQRLDDALEVKAKRDEVAAAWIRPAGAAGNPATNVPFGTKAGTPPVQAGASPRLTNLLRTIDPDRNAVAGTWAMKDGALVSAGNNGAARLEIPYEAPAEYDFQISFTKKTGGCVIQNLTVNEHPFIWVMSADGMFTFHYVKGAGAGANKTTVNLRVGIKDNRRYTSLVKVRKNGAEAFLDGKLITQWKTDFSDTVHDGFWALPNKSCLGVASGNSHVIFHSIEVREVSEPGKLLK